MNKFPIGTAVEIVNDSFYGMMIGYVREHHGLCSVVEINEGTIGKHKIVVLNEQLKIWESGEVAE